jgi:hypothetical protein
VYKKNERRKGWEGVMKEKEKKIDMQIKTYK